MNDQIKIDRHVERLSTVDKLRKLLDITKTISRSLDLEEVLNLVMHTLGSLVPYDAAGIYLIEFSPEDKSPYVFKSKALRGYNISFELIEPRLRMGEGFRTPLNREPILSHRDLDPRYCRPRIDDRTGRTDHLQIRHRRIRSRE